MTHRKSTLAVQMTNRYRSLASILLITLVTLAASGQAQAQISMFLELDGIPGDATAAGYENQVIIGSYSHGLSSPVLIGGGGGPQLTNLQHSAISFTKDFDPSTTPLLQKMSSGNPISTAKFDFVTGAAKTGGVMPMLVMRVELTDVYVESYSTSFGGGGAISESWSFAYTTIKITYYHDNGSTSTWSYNVETQTELAASVEGVRFLVDGEDVVFAWRTLSESGNYGFEIQHLEEAEYRRAAYIPGAGWSSETLEYEVRIRGLRPGVHTFRLASLGIGGKVSYSDPMLVALGVPQGTTLALDAPYPNPFTTSTNVSITSDRARDARIAVYDVLGREVQVLFEGTLNSGAKERYTFEAPAGLAPGLYMIRVESEDAVRTRPVVLGR